MSSGELRKMVGSLENFKPSWNHWLNLIDVSVDEAVCLSLDADPSILEAQGSGWGGLIGLQEFLVHYSSRHDAARAHINVQRLSVRHDPLEKRDFVVLATFRKWGEGLPVPLTFPKEFPSLATETEPAVAPKATKNESTSRNQNAMLGIIAAMLQLLLDKEGGGFPSNAKVIEALLDKYGDTYGISERNLQKTFPLAMSVAGDNLRPRTKNRK